MTAISTTGVKDKGDIPFLKYKNQKQGLAFSGSTLPTLLQIGFVDPDGTFIPLTGGTITVLPQTLVVNSMPVKGLALNVSGGSPDFSIDDAGLSGPIT